MAESSNSRNTGTKRKIGSNYPEYLVQPENKKKKR